MNFYYILISGGIYLILALILIVFWLLISRLKIQKKSKSIIFVLAMLVAFFLIRSIKSHWYDIFTYHLEVLDKDNGFMIITNRSFEQVIGKNKNGKPIVIDKHAGDLITPKEYQQLLNSPEEEDYNFEGKRDQTLSQNKGKIKRVFIRDQIDTVFKVSPILILAYFINSLLAYFVWYGTLLDEYGESKVPKLIIGMCNALVYLIAILISVAIIYPHFLDEMLLAIGSSGAIAAFLGREPVKQAFTALSLNLNKQIRKGDFLDVEGFMGEVQEIGWKSIKLLTYDNNLLTIPNTTLVASNVINYSRPGYASYVEMEVMVSSGVSPKRVMDLLKRSALDSDYVLEDPIVSLVDIRGTRSEYLLMVSTDHPNPNIVKSEVLSAIWHMLKRVGIHTSGENEKIEKPVEKATKLIQSVTVFEAFTEEENLKIAENAKWERYGHPERVVVEGDTDSTLFIIAEGILEVLISQPNGSYTKVAELGKNAIFGEMALLTGEPRKATVRAASDVLVCKISKDTIKPILHERQSILNDLSEKLAERQMQLEKTKAKGKAQTKRKKDSVAKKLLGLMKNFFREDEVDSEEGMKHL